MMRRITARAAATTQPQVSLFELSPSWPAVPAPTIAVVLLPVMVADLLVCVGAGAVVVVVAVVVAVVVWVGVVLVIVTGAVAPPDCALVAVVPAAVVAVGVAALAAPQVAMRATVTSAQPIRPSAMGRSCPPPQCQTSHDSREFGRNRSTFKAARRLADNTIVLEAR
jgi:hypothetical protein